LHLYVTRIAFVSLAENNSCSCKLSRNGPILRKFTTAAIVFSQGNKSYSGYIQVQNFDNIDPCFLAKKKKTKRLR